MATDTAQQTRSAQIRRPRQKRSQERFEAILDAAARVLEHAEPDKVSIYTIAEAADMSPPSIYHFFPDAQYVFVALAERYFDIFIRGEYGSIEGAQLATWQDWVSVRYRLSRAFYNDHAAARKIILGSASWTIRSRDLDLDRVLAKSALAELGEYFLIPDIPGLVDRMVETIVLNDALWALANHRDGRITDEADEYAGRARVAHMRTYFPEYLPVRERAAPAGE